MHRVALHCLCAAHLAAALASVGFGAACTINFDDIAADGAINTGDIGNNQGDDDDEPPPGSEGGPCYGNGTCDAGLTCASDLCVAVGVSEDPPEDEESSGGGSGEDPGSAGGSGEPDGGGGSDDTDDVGGSTVTLDADVCAWVSCSDASDCGVCTDAVCEAAAACGESVSLSNATQSGTANWTPAGAGAVSVYSWSYGAPGVFVYGDPTTQYGTIAASVSNPGPGPEAFSGLCMGLQPNTYGDEWPYNGPSGICATLAPGRVALMAGVSNTPQNFVHELLAQTLVDGLTTEGFHDLALEVRLDGTVLIFLDGEPMVAYALDAALPPGRFGLLAANGSFEFRDIQTHVFTEVVDGSSP